MFHLFFSKWSTLKVQVYEGDKSSHNCTVSVPMLSLFMLLSCVLLPWYQYCIFKISVTLIYRDTPSLNFNTVPFRLTFIIFSFITFCCCRANYQKKIWKQFKDQNQSWIWFKKSLIFTWQPVGQKNKLFEFKWSQTLCFVLFLKQAVFSLQSCDF